MTNTRLTIFRGDTCQFTVTLPNGAYATGSASLTLFDGAAAEVHVFTAQTIPSGTTPPVTFTAAASATALWPVGLLRGQVRLSLSGLVLTPGSVEIIVEQKTG